MGYLPEAVVNFLGAPGLGARRRGDLHARRVRRTGSTSARSASAPSRFDADKLKWVNHEHLKRLSGGRARATARAVPRARRARSRGGPDAGRGRDAVARPRRDARRKWPTRRTTSTRRRTRPGQARRRSSSAARSVAALVAICTRISPTSPGRARRIGAGDEGGCGTRHGLKPPQVMMAMRVLVAGTTRDAGDRRACWRCSGGTRHGLAWPGGLGLDLKSCRATSQCPPEEE